MKRLLFVYNRHAGKDRNWAALSEILDVMTAQGYLVTSYPTQAPGDAGEAIARWGGSYDRIVVAGGDGTLNEGVSGMLRLPQQPPMGYIPIGSTNDFSKNLSLPANTVDAALTAVGGVPRPCDVGRFNGKPFIYVAAFGAFVDVPFTTPQPIKNIFGYTAYLLESVKRLGSIRPYALRVEHDGELLEGEFIYGMVSNTNTVGGFRNFPPGKPELDDGLLEVTLIREPRDILQLEQFGRALLLGDSLEGNPMLRSFSAAKLRFEAREELIWTVDGENGGMHRSGEVSVEPKAFVIVHGA